jgi:ribosomal protein L22
LYVAEAYAHRARLEKDYAKGKGRAYRIRKRTSHITVVLKGKSKVAGDTMYVQEGG